MLDFKKKRLEKGLTLDMLSELTGIKVSTLDYIESANSCKIKDAIKIANGLGISLDELCDMGKPRYHKYDIKDKVRTKIHYMNDTRTEVNAIIRGIDISDYGKNIKYEIAFTSNKKSSKEIRTNALDCTGYVEENDIIEVLK